MALLNSVITVELMKVLSPTINFEVGNIAKVPVILASDLIPQIKSLVDENIQISKEDWDAFEVSWDFKKHPLVNSHSLQNANNEWTNMTKNRFNKIKSNEEKLNEILINIYNLTDEFNPTISDNDIAIRTANLSSDVRSFISYFIGCMLGRYSLDSERVVYAGGDWDNKHFLSFNPLPDGIINFTDTFYFENDVIVRLREFLSVAFSSDTVDENIQWLAEALEMKKGEDAEARLRRYFLDEFFADHCKIYQKKPIYWLVDSGKQKGLRTLIYMHRYQPDTMATIRFEHLQEIQAKYQNEINDLENRLVNPNLSASEKKKLSAEKTSFEKKMDELREFDKRLAEIANEEIEIDLDDGVKMNYEKFYRGGKGVLAKIK